MDFFLNVFGLAEEPEFNCYCLQGLNASVPTKKLQELLHS